MLGREIKAEKKKGGEKGRIKARRGSRKVRKGRGR